MTGADKKRLRLVRAAILGNRPDHGTSNTLYVVYIAVIAAGSYGVPASQQLFRSLDLKWLGEQAWTPGGAFVSATLAALLLTLIWLVGRVRGPVVPGLPYLDMVVASPMPRRVTLARHWQLSLGGSVVGCLLIGLVVGTGLAIAQVVPPIALLPATLGGVLLGGLVADVWLRGQLRGQQQTTPLGSRPGLHHLNGRRNALALLDITGLRRQAASSTIMGGGVLSGDLRIARLEAVPPTTYGRRVRLRASGRWLVIARRDVLGLRRAPWSALYGLSFAAAGSACLMMSLRSPQTPIIAPLVSLVVCYLGFGAWCEGLRLHADNAGTSRLLGLSYRETAFMHLVVPVAAWSLTNVVVSAGLSLGNVATPAGLVWGLGTGALLAGSHLKAACRGMPPARAFDARAGVQAMLFWYATPLLACLVVGTATAAWAGRAASAWPAFSLLVIATAGVIWWGLAAVDKLDRRT